MLGLPLAPGPRIYLMAYFGSEERRRRRRRSNSKRR